PFSVSRFDRFPRGSSWESAPRSTARSFEMESFFPAYSYNWAPPLALVSGRWKYIATPRPELYDLAADPGETRNLLEGLDRDLGAKPTGPTSGRGRDPGSPLPRVSAGEPEEAAAATPHGAPRTTSPVPASRMTSASSA